MKVKLKTADQLLKEGWSYNKRSLNNYLEIVSEQGHREIGLSRSFVETSLGKEVHVTNINVPYYKDQVAKVDIVLDEVKTKEIPYTLFEKFNVKKFKIEAHQIGGDRLKWNGFNFKFGCRNMTIQEAVEAANWILAKAKSARL